MCYGKVNFKENKKIFTTPLSVDNPILVQVLGICSALAVTSQLKPAIVMGLAVTIITAFSNVIMISYKTYHTKSNQNYSPACSCCGISNYSKSDSKGCGI